MRMMIDVVIVVVVVRGCSDGDDGMVIEWACWDEEYTLI